MATPNEHQQRFEEGIKQVHETLKAGGKKEDLQKASKALLEHYDTLRKHETEAAIIETARAQFKDILEHPELEKHPEIHEEIKKRIETPAATGSEEKKGIFESGFGEKIKDFGERAKQKGREVIDTDWHGAYKEKKAVNEMREKQIQAAFEGVSEFLASTEERDQMKTVISTVIVTEVEKILAAQKEKNPDQPLLSLPEAVEAYLPNIKKYLGQHIYHQSEGVEADTTELKALLEKARNASPAEIRSMVHEKNEELKRIQTEIETEKETKNELESQHSRLIKELEALRGKNVGDKGAEPSDEQKRRLGDLSGKIDTANINLKTNAKKVKAVNKEINIINQGASDGLKKAKKVPAETLLTLTVSYFKTGEAKREGKTVNELAIMSDSIKKANEITAEISLEQTSRLRRVFGIRNGSGGLKDVIGFLGSKEGPFAGDLPEKALPVIGRLAAIKPDNLKEAEKWIMNLANAMQEPEMGEKTEGAVVKVISHLQSLIDEKRFRKAQISSFAIKKVITLKQNLGHAYEKALAVKTQKKVETGTLDQDKSLKDLMSSIEKFHRATLEGRLAVSSSLNEDFGAYLKGAGVTEGEKNEKSEGKGGVKKAAGTALAFLWKKMKENPIKSSGGVGLIAAASYLGAYPVMSTAATGYTGYKIYKWWKSRNSSTPTITNNPPTP